MALPRLTRRRSVCPQMFPSARKSSAMAPGKGAGAPVHEDGGVAAAVTGRRAREEPKLRCRKEDYF
jgi:hypothetical protein